MQLDVAGIPDPCNVTASAPVAGSISVKPVAVSNAPLGFAEFEQPWPGAPVLPHGHGTGSVPSPEHVGVDGSFSPTTISTVSSRFAGSPRLPELGPTCTARRSVE